MSQFSLTGLATGLISGLGYGGLAAGLALGTCGIPIPSEVLLPVSGALINTGHFSFWPIVAIGAVAQTAGAALAYWLGSTGGLALAKRYGKYVLFSDRELAITQRYFDRYGKWLALFGPCLPVVRAYLGYPAGLAKMGFAKFIGAFFVGALVWSWFLTELGVKLATPDRLLALDRLFRKFDIIAVVLLVLGLIWYVRRHLKESK